MRAGLALVVAFTAFALAASAASAERVTGCVFGGDCVVDDVVPEGPIIVCVVDGPFCGFGFPERPCVVGEACLVPLP